MSPIFYPLKAKSAPLDILLQHRKEAEARENQLLFAGAARSGDHSRYHGAEEDHRLPYKRDVDRIVHSKAYARYIDKTQVAYLVDNEHITRRSLHVQLVSNFARGIAEVLRLNVDLVEAIALGHDVGHPPFGHEGEQYLSKLSKEFAGHPFNHPQQSCRLFREIEPLNLGLAVYDGFLCHDGGMKQNHYIPNRGKRWEDHFAELDKVGQNLWPTTLEGCLVKLCDTASYVGRDIQDAIRLGLITRDQVPKTLLGTFNREILSNVAGDIITESYEQDRIAMSEEVFAALKEIRAFNFRNIYLHPALKTQSKKIERSYRLLFERLLEDYQTQKEESHLWTHFLHNKPEPYLATSEPVDHVIDYISGMTDRYFIQTLENLIVPGSIVP